jgi:type 1 glutamine amidotransferase
LFCFFSTFLVGHVVAFASGNDVNLLFLGDQKGHNPSLRFRIIESVMAERGIKLTYTEDVDKLNAQSLSKYDGLVLYANIDTIKPLQAKALLDYVASGKGFVPIHCATFCFRNSPEVVALMGGQFKSHGQGEMTTQLASVEHSNFRGLQDLYEF